MPENITLILDFDSTIVQVETLDELIKLSFQKHSPTDKADLLSQIKYLTHGGMDGSVSIEESLDKRVSMLNANKADVASITSLLLDKISPSILENRDFFMQNKDNVYIVSAGFTECIKPIAEFLGLKSQNIFANEFIYDTYSTNIIGIDKSLPLAQTKGKVKAIRSLNLIDRIVHVVGDGFTDYEIKSEGAANKFFAYTETISRELVIKKADCVVGNFNEYLNKRTAYLT